MNPKAVLFDLFETLITEFENGRRKSNRKYDYETLLGLDHLAFKAEWGARAERRMNGTFRHYRDVIRDMLEARSLPYPHDHVELLYRARAAEKRLPFTAPDDAIVTMLQMLRDRGMKLGLVSNCTEEEVQGWRDCELAPLFDTVVFSYEAGAAKPDPAIYRQALARLGLQPHEAVFVGDGGSSELEGAERIGIQPLHARWYNHRIDSRCPQVSSPAELLEAIDRLIEADGGAPQADH